MPKVPQVCRYSHLNPVVSEESVTFFGFCFARPRRDRRAQNNANYLKDATRQQIVSWESFFPPDQIEIPAFKRTVPRDRNAR